MYDKFSYSHLIMKKISIVLLIKIMIEVEDVEETLKNIKIRGHYNEVVLILEWMSNEVLL